MDALNDSVFWTGLLILCVGAAALIPRRAGLPAATAALAAGTILLQGIDLSGLRDRVPLADEGLALVASLSTATLGMLIGSQIDPGILRSRAVSIGSGVIAQVALAAGSVFLAGIFVGYQTVDALTLGLAACATSPIALAAVLVEQRGRGDLTQRALVCAPLSLVLAQGGLIVAGGSQDGGPWRAAAVLGGSLLLGSLVGLVILIPISRMATRGAMIACVAAAACLLSWISLRAAPGRSHLVVMSVLSGFVVGSLSATRTLYRETLRDLGLPGSIVLFGILGVTLPGTPLALLSLGAVAVAAARWIGIWCACRVVSGARHAIREAAILTPMAGMLAAIPALPGETSGVARTLVGATLLSLFAGMPAASRALRGAGESPRAREDPDAWRASMT